MMITLEVPMQHLARMLTRTIVDLPARALANRPAQFTLTSCGTLAPYTRTHLWPCVMLAWNFGILHARRCDASHARAHAPPRACCCVSDDIHLRVHVHCMSTQNDGQRSFGKTTQSSYAPKPRAGPYATDVDKGKVLPTETAFNKTSEAKFAPKDTGVPWNTGKGGFSWRAPCFGLRCSS